jgi:hypothetical protein
MLLGEDDPKLQRLDWNPKVKPDPHIDAARKELTAYVSGSQ